MMATDSCLFCRILRGEIPAQIVYETPHVVAFRDIAPQAPYHVVIIPREHVASLNDTRDPETRRPARDRGGGTGGARRVRGGGVPHGDQHQCRRWPDGLPSSPAFPGGPEDGVASGVDPAADPDLDLDSI